MSSLLAARDLLHSSLSRFNIPLVSKDIVSVNHLLALAGSLDSSRFSFDSIKNVDGKEHEHGTSPLYEAVLLLSKVSLLSTLSNEERQSFYDDNTQSEETKMIKDFTSQSKIESNEVIKSIAQRLIPTNNIERNELTIILNLLQPLLERTEMLLSLGGDDRLTIDFNGQRVNKYFSSTFPRYGMVQYSTIHSIVVYIQHVLTYD